jgi:putative glutathione S-transferase
MNKLPATDGGGHFERPPSQFRQTIDVDGEHPPQRHRYHLYASLGCPWVSSIH